LKHDQPSEPFGLALALLSKREATLQIQQVHYFIALCEELNFTCAARRCGVSQPSLSNAISALERELGGALFHRKPSIALTGLGRMVRPYLDEIARNADHAREVARTLTPRPSIHRPSSRGKFGAPIELMPNG
jgi:DNA-binding transcriptional LysR family regulator